MEKIITHSENETKTLARRLALTLVGGDILCLHGNLGAGKTTFVKGLAQGLGVEQEMTSPTFTLMNIYPVAEHHTIKQLAHIDTYRLKDARELIEIGVEDYLGQPGVLTVIEWPEKIENLLKKKKVRNVTFVHEGNDRHITII